MISFVPSALLGDRSSRDAAGDYADHAIAIANCVGRVRHQVHEKLRNLAGIAADGGKVPGQVGLDCGALADGYLEQA